MKTTHFSQKWPNDVILGQKWRHTSKISRDMTKIFFSNYSKHQVEQLFLQQFSLKTTLNGWKLLIFVKKTSLWAKNDVIMSKMRRDTTIFFPNYSKQQVEQLFLWQFSLKMTLKGWKLVIFLKNGQKTSFWAEKDAKNDVICRKLDIVWKIFFFLIF